MIGVFHILEALVAAHVAGNELITVVDAQAIGIGFEGQCLTGILRGDGIAVGVDGNAKWPGLIVLSRRQRDVNRRPTRSQSSR